LDPYRSVEAAVERDAKGAALLRLVGYRRSRVDSELSPTLLMSRLATVVDTRPVKLMEPPSRQPFRGELSAETFSVRRNVTTRGKWGQRQSRSPILITGRVEPMTHGCRVHLVTRPHALAWLTHTAAAMLLVALPRITEPPSAVRWPVTILVPFVMVLILWFQARSDEREFRERLECLAQT
jgi:hypothetical protein